MKILFLQLSDIHIKRYEDGIAIQVDKLVDALNSIEPVDECVIILSGDITQNGLQSEYKVAGSMIGSLLKELKKKKINDNFIHVVLVPGNHDMDLIQNNRTGGEICAAFQNGSLDEMVEKDLKSLNNFFDFASKSKCYGDNALVSRKKLVFNGFIIDFALINTAVFSLLGSKNEDMGIHYLSEKCIDQLVLKRDGNIGIVVMHHSTEWFAQKVKEKLRNVLSENYSLVFEGHEHDGFSESRRLNNKSSTIFMQGNSLSGDKNHTKGFNAIILDTKEMGVKGYSFVWNRDYYKQKEILQERLYEKSIHRLDLKDEFLSQIKYDDTHQLISAYFVFPTLSYTVTNEEELETKKIENMCELKRTVYENDRTIISGDNKAGKSTLAKELLQEIYNDSSGIVPLLLISEDLNNKKIDRIIEYAFEEQYKEEENSYDKYLQLHPESRILIIDDAGLIQKPKLDKILAHYDDMFSKIILFSEDEININIQKLVVDALTEKKVAHMVIKPFLYDKRKELIKKVLAFKKSTECDEKQKEIIDEMNNMISSQARYFKLNPEFIVNFAGQYSSNLTFNPNENIFNMVYENSIKNKIISKADQQDANNVFNVLTEMAFDMHFAKKTWATPSDLVTIIERYNADFRRKVKIVTFLDVAIRTRLIVEKDLKYRFKDNNILSYFVAQALNKKSHYDEDYLEIKGKIEDLLHNLCFGINSDIVMFMALITSNVKIIGVVLECAYMHFDNIEELNFDKKNIAFLASSDFQVKNSLPNNEEKKEKERQIILYEEELKTSELVELVDMYDYDESDIKTIGNQILKSIKYIEILSKILPVFSHNMKVTQQNQVVMAIYSFPNRFIYQWLEDINNHYDEFIQGLFDEISAIRKEKNISELNIESVEKMIEQMAITVIISLYQLVASTCATRQTIEALDEFHTGDNTNYAIMNLMMTEKTGNLKSFKEKANKISDASEQQLIKSLVKYTVRNYFLHHEVKLVGEGQSLIDKYFGTSETKNSTKKRLMTEMIKNKLHDK